MRIPIWLFSVAILWYKILTSVPKLHEPIYIRTGQIANSRNIFTRIGKSSTPVMFSESAIAQHLLNNLMCAKGYSEKKINYSFIWPFVV